MLKQLRVGIVGFGGAGRAHFWRFGKVPEAEIVAIFDPKPENVAEFFRRSHVANPPRLTNDWRKFLASEGMQVVSICSPDHEHAQQAIDCFKHGLHVLVEKPMATSSPDGLCMIEAGRTAARHLMAHHQMRYLPVFKKAKKLAADGTLGRVFGLEADYYHDMRQRAVQYDDWRMQSASFQNIVFGGACHPLDLMQWVSDAKIEEVFAYANHEAFKAYPDVDSVVAVLKFSTGAIGRMTMTIGCNRPSEHTLVVLGDGGTFLNGLLLRTERTATSALSTTANPNVIQRALLRVIRNFKLRTAHESTMTHFPSETVNFMQRFLGRVTMAFGNTVHFPYSMNEHGLACENLISGFLKSIITDTSPPINPMESLDAIRVCEAIIQSYKTGQPVAVARDPK